MNANRVNVYAFPHKGIRNFMSQVSMLAGTTDYSQTDQLDELKSVVNDLINFLTLHLNAEEQVVLPALEERVPGSTTANHEAHDVIKAEEKQFHQMLEAITVSSSPAAGAEFYKTFANFHSNYLAHMAMEEDEMLTLIWDNFTDEELMQVHGKVMAHLSPDAILLMFKYIVPALNPMERAIIMGGFKANAPADFFAVIFDMLKNNMSAKAHAQLDAMLSQPA